MFKIFLILSFTINDVKSTFYNKLEEKNMENIELINKAICYAKKNFNNADLSVENVADYAGFSIDYFNRICKWRKPAVTFAEQNG